MSQPWRMLMAETSSIECTRRRRSQRPGAHHGGGRRQCEAAIGSSSGRPRTRINGLQLQERSPSRVGYAMVIRVPASFDGPHRYNATRFVLRSGTHAMDMTYDQLRNAFGRRATIAASIKAFVAERRAALKQSSTWATCGPCRADGVPLRHAHLQRPGRRVAGISSTASWRRLAIRLACSTQAFRNGAFETVRIAKALGCAEGQRLDLGGCRHDFLS